MKESQIFTVRFFNLINISFSSPSDCPFFSLMHVIKGELYSYLENQIMWHWLVDKLILKEVTLLNAHPSLPIQACKPWPYRFEVLDNHIWGETGLSFIISPLNALGRISSLHHKVWSEKVSLMPIDSHAGSWWVWPKECFYHFYITFTCTIQVLPDTQFFLLWSWEPLANNSI